jgi:ribosome-associated protein
VLVDLGDVVVHVFSQDAREYFGLERLWGDAEELAVERAVAVS